MISLLSIKLTNKCNLACPYCYEDAGHELDNEITLEDIKKIINIVNPTFAIEFSGGECLTKYDLVVQAKDYAFTKVNEVRIATNGTIPININDFIPPPGKKITFAVSLDGFEEDHDKNRGKGTFQKTLDFSKKLIEQGIPVYCSSIAPRHYYDNNGELLKKFHNFLINFGFYKHYNTTAIKQGRGINFEQYSNQEKETIYKIQDDIGIKNRNFKNCPLFKNQNLNEIMNPGVVSVNCLGFIETYCHVNKKPFCFYSDYNENDYILNCNDYRKKVFEKKGEGIINL